jgi:hypothetical protein
MRRPMLMVLALMFPLVASSLAAGAPAGSTASPAAAGSAAGSASAAASAAPPASAAASGSAAAPAPAPAVSVEMNGKPSDEPVTGATYSVRLRDLEQRVDELKGQIRRSHTRLALLSDTIMGGGAAGSRAEVEFHNEMSNAFVLTRALFVMDGQIQYNRQDDSGALGDQKTIPIYTGSMPPGDHTIQLSLTFQGNGFGVFSYLRGYKFEVKSSHPFTALEGKVLTVTATAYEKGDLTTPLEQRPTIEWQEKVQPLTPANAGNASPASAPPAGAPPSTNGGGAK